MTNDDVAKTPDPLEVLAFIHGHSAMPSDQWKARFPDWHDRIPAALERFRLETDYGRRGWAKSDVMVNCEADAIHRWVFLPLIRAALEAGSRP